MPQACAPEVAMFEFRDRELLREILSEVKNLKAERKVFMALADDLLQAVTDETTAVDSALKLLQGYIDNGTITPDQGANLIAAISAEKNKVNAALVANTPVAPTQAAAAA
jgi:hypothetical protein